MLSQFQSQIELQFHKGMIVFAKCENCEPWPAKIIKIDFYQIDRKYYFTVLFYNDKSTSVLEEQNLEPFDEQTIKTYRKCYLLQKNSQSKKILKAISMAEIALVKENHKMKKQELGKLEKEDLPKKRLTKNCKSREIHSQSKEDNTQYLLKQMNKQIQSQNEQNQEQKCPIATEQAIKQVSENNIDKYGGKQQIKSNMVITSVINHEFPNENVQNIITNSDKKDKSFSQLKQQNQFKQDIICQNQDVVNPQRQSQAELEHKIAQSEITEAQIKNQQQIDENKMVEIQKIEQIQAVIEMKSINIIQQIKNVDKSYKELLLHIPQAIKSFNHLSQFQVQKIACSYIKLITNYLQNKSQSILSFPQKINLFALLRLTQNIENKSSLISHMVQFILQFEREQLCKKQYYSVEYLIIRQKLQGICAFRNQLNFDNNVKQILIDYVQRKGRVSD